MISILMRQRGHLCVLLSLLICAGCLRDSGDFGGPVARDDADQGVDVVSDQAPKPVDLTPTGYTDERCARLDECTLSGQCVASADGARCTVTPDSCAQSTGCTRAGLCSASLDQSRCEVTDEGCAQSQSCEQLGECVASADALECVSQGLGCAQLEACARDGLCGEGEDGLQCVPNAAGCAQSERCMLSGRCGLSADELVCVYTDEGCAQQSVCAVTGRCGASADGGECVMTPTGCAQSEACLESGLCAFSTHTQRCVATQEGCADSTICAQLGRCEVSEDELSCVTSGVRVGLGDTAPLRCSDAFCPSARLSKLALFTSAEEASARGCDTQGTSGGLGLNGIFDLSGADLADLVTPDENNQVQVLMLGLLSGWPQGLTGNSAGDINLQLFDGVQSDAGTFIDPRSLTTNGSPRLQFSESTIRDGLLVSSESTFELTLPESLFNLFIFDYTSVIGDIQLTPDGFELSEGVVSGYLTRGTLITMLNVIYSQCGVGQEPRALPVPDFCASIISLLTGEHELDLTLLASFVPYDTILNDTGRAPCSQERLGECNAISVCLSIEMSPIRIAGIAE